MFIIRKLIFFVVVIVILAIGLVALFGRMLNIDDLAQCGVSPDVSNSHCRPADAIVAISGGDTDARTQEAIKLYKANWAPRLIFSGAALDRQGTSNAAAMRTQALNAGVDASAITIDEVAVDTADNAKKTKQLLESGVPQRVILVTSPYHQLRASIEFKRTLGPTAEIVSHPTPNDKAWPSNWWLTPSGWGLVISETAKVIYINLGGHS
ncbi:MAG TPA: YdcF family protein [Patescibacteria group bacterium]|jgi:uncharacterized SAM-binding protein YcdF (DUF218 family)|nr:YdcF family protein [Patescibacteria group bacterium]